MAEQKLMSNWTEKFNKSGRKIQGRRQAMAKGGRGVGGWGNIF